MNALLRLERSAVLPLLRVLMVTYVLIARFVGSGAQVRRLLVHRPPELLDAPHLEAVARFFGVWPFSAEFAVHAEVVLVVAGVCAVFGAFTRVSLFVCFVVFFFDYAVIAGFGFFNHTPALPGQLLLALAILPGTTAFSVDRWLLHRWRRRRDPSLPLLDTLWPAVPRFGEVFVCAAVGFIYAASGFAKLRLGAADWLNGETLRWYLGHSPDVALYYGEAGSGRIDGYLYQAQSRAVSAWMATTFLPVPLSWATLATELSAPVMLVLGGRWRVGWCAVAIGFHIGVVALVGPAFNEWIVVEVCLAAPILYGLKRRTRSPTTAGQSA